MKIFRTILTALLLMFCGGMSAIAADFFEIDWKKIPVDSICPLYTEVIPLEGQLSASYKVILLYPEWEELSASEAVKMAQWKDSIGEELVISTFVGRSRGKALLDVSFVPVVLRDGKYLRLMSAKMEITPGAASAQASNTSTRGAANRSKASERYTRQSKLSTGKWVKIAIADDGIIQLSRAGLQRMGFKNPDNVHLYGYGGHRLSEVSDPENEFDDLEEVPLYKADSNRWLFWGNGLLYWDGNTRVFNPYATEACYFLTEEDKPGSIEEIESLKASANKVTSFTDHILYEKDGFAYHEGGRNLYDPEDFASRNSRTYSLSTPSTCLGDENLTIAFTAAEATKMTPTVNGKAQAAMSFNDPGKYTFGTGVTKSFDVSSLKNGSTWNIQLQTTSGTHAHLDYLDLRYTRQINPQQTFVAFSAGKKGTVTYQIAGAGDSYKVMLVGAPGQQACLIKPVAVEGKKEVTVEDGMRRLVCFNPASVYPEPMVIGDVANQNLHSLDSLDMVIIVPENGLLTAQAERLAEAHRAYDGMRVAVVRADQVYNEFSSGTYDATAYRRLMKMLFDRADGDEAQMPRYLLLFGDCLWDNRLISFANLNMKQADYLLCFESENSFSDPRSYMMEDYFALLDDGEGKNLLREKPDLGVGRFPVVRAEDAKIMVDKHIEYISNQNAGEWKNRVLMIGDDGDNNSHMQYCDDLAEILENKYPQLEINKVMFDAFRRVSTLTMNGYPDITNLIHQQLTDGVLFVNYTGHGSEILLSHERVWAITEFEKTSGRKLPLWMTAACITMPLDGTTRNQGEVAVTMADGGCLAFLGTTRTVYASNNAQINRLFSQNLFDMDALGRRNRIGDALCMAKATLVGIEGSNLENKIQYVLAGDPALLIGNPTNRVIVDHILNRHTGEVADGLKAGMPVRLLGHIEGADGDTLKMFNGMLNLRVYDSKDVITCKNNAGDAKEPFVFSNYESLLFTSRDSVRNGQFDLSFIVPKDIKYSNEIGRMVLYAINDSLTMEANGYRQDFTVGGSVDITDNQGPQMELLVNGEPGGVVNATPYLTARLTDESGINHSGTGVGHDLLVSVDNNPEWTSVVNDYYQPDFGDFTTGSLAYTLPQLPDGQHTVTLRSWDMMNNTSIASLDFTVDNSYKPAILSLSNSPNPAVTGTTFFINSDLPGSVCEYLIEVFDFTGRRIWSHHDTNSSSTGQFAVYWNLSVGSGYGKVGPGVYLYRATLQTGESKRVTKSKKLIVNW